MINKVSEGERLLWANNTAAVVSSGDVVPVGDMIGIAVKDIAVGETENLDIEGEFELAKGADEALTQGKTVYWDTENSKITAIAGDNILAGKVTVAAAAAATTVKVKINS